jgi:hypothetical protein
MLVIGAVYNIPAVSLGVLPSVVYLIDAWLVASVIFTIASTLVVSPGGDICGSVTCPDPEAVAPLDEFVLIEGWQPDRMISIIPREMKTG